MSVPIWLWFVTVGIFVGLIVADFYLVDAGHHAFGVKQAARWVTFYIALAVAFGAFVALYWAPSYAGEFFAGYITEYSLSVDNLFVFVVLMSSFLVPQELQHRVLLIGVLIALVLRTVLILLGAAAVSKFIATFFVFGLFLLWTAWKVWTSGDKEPDPDGNAIVRFAERRLPSTRHYHGHQLTVVVHGKRLITPMALVILAIGTTDLIFALDSIPAVLGLTHQPYLIVSINFLALMGLRQLYFLLHGLLDRLIYLNKGLGIILGFVANKLILEALGGTTHWHVPEISTAFSLIFIVVVLAVTALVSWIAVSRNPELAKLSGSAEADRDAAAEAGLGLSHLRDDEDDADEPGAAV